MSHKPLEMSGLRVLAKCGKMIMYHNDKFFCKEV